MKALNVLLAAILFSSSAAGGPKISAIVIKEDIVELSLQLDRTFDWNSIRFVSVKTFDNDPPWFPPTRHELTFDKNGICEWFQYDYIEIGNFNIKGKDAVEVKIGNRKIKGKFDFKANLLKFDGLDYEPMIKSPPVKVNGSADLKDWKKVRVLEAAEKESEWGRPLTIRCKLSTATRQFFSVQIYDD